MNNDFLEEKNFKFLINRVFTDIRQRTSHNINDKKYFNIFKKLVETIHEKNINKRVSKEYLNTLVIDKCVPFIIQKIEKDNRTDRLVNVQNQSVVTSSRPISSKMSSNKDFSNLSLGNDFNRSVNFENKPNIVDNISGISSRNGEKIDYTSKLNQLSMDRNYDNENNSLNKQMNMGNMGNMDNRQQMNMGNMGNMGNLDNRQQMNMGNMGNLDNRQQMNMGNINNQTENNRSINEIMGENGSDGFENVDIMKKMRELENERNYNASLESNDKFTKGTTIKQLQNNKQLDSLKSNNIKNDNDFFKQLQQNQPSLNKNYMDMDIDISRNENNLEDSYDNMYKNSRVNAYNDENKINVVGSVNAINASNNINNLELSIKDQTNDLDNINTIQNLKEQQDIITKNDQKKELIDNTFMGTGYNFERRKKKVLAVDISNNLPDLTDGTSIKKVIQNIAGDYWSHFKVNLQEDLIIDNTSDVFLESITINNPAQATNQSNLYFVINIDEFNIKTLSNNPFMQDKFVIPNEFIKSDSENKIMKYHLKSNYVASINPCRLSSLTFKITNEDNQTVNSNINSTAATTINNSGGYSTGSTSINVTDGGVLAVDDVIYKKNGEVIGLITNIATNTLTLTASLAAVSNKEEIYTSSLKTGVLINESNGYDIGDTTLTVDTIDATNVISNNDKLYLGTGDFIGEVESVTSTSITIKNGINLFLSDNKQLYRSNPRETVLRSNSKNNRIVMEFVIISR